MLPNIEHSILDKLVILKASKQKTNFSGAEARVAQEMPAFADFVSGWQIPAELMTRPDEVARFGFNSWHHPELMETARDSSSSAGVLELLEMWRPQWFRKNSQPQWTGTATELLGELKATETVSSLVDRVAYSRNSLGTELQHLILQGCNWITFRRNNNTRTYSIARPEALPIK